MPEPARIALRLLGLLLLLGGLAAVTAESGWIKAQIAVLNSQLRLLTTAASVTSTGG